MGLADDFLELFEGNPTAYGLAHGEAIKDTTVDTRLVDRHLNDPALGGIGVYPLRVIKDKQWGPYFVKWGCSDIDTYESAWEQVSNLKMVLDTLGIASWIERSKSKGYHLWVFADDWIPASVMRRALLFAHDVAEIPPREVNPKQTEVAHLKAMLGNYVNLPFPHGWGALRSDGHPGRCVVDPFADVPLGVRRFVNDALTTRNTFDALYEVARMYVPPPPKQHVPVAEYDGNLDHLVSRLGGLAAKIFREGPLQPSGGRAGRDRSTTLARLAHLAREDHLSPTEVYALLVDADQRWGKFHDREDGDEQLQSMVDNAFAKGS